MPGIVILTTKGEVKRDFVNALHKETGGAVALAVLQNVKKKTAWKRVSSFFRKVGFQGLLPELYHFLAMKLSRKKRAALALLSLRTPLSAETGYLMETTETDDVNSDDVYNRISALHPDLIVIWGGYIVKPRLLAMAPHTLNMHFGFTPYYIRVNGVHEAILQNDLEHIGITIHYAVPQVDAGDVLQVVTADHRKPPEVFFKELNDTAAREYIAVVKKIMSGEHVYAKPQHAAEGKNYFLKEWTYAKQDALARKLLSWKKRGHA